MDPAALERRYDLRPVRGLDLGEGRAETRCTYRWKPESSQRQSRPVIRLTSAFRISRSPMPRTRLILELGYDSWTGSPQGANAASTLGWTYDAEWEPGD